MTYLVTHIQTYILPHTHTHTHTYNYKTFIIVYISSMRNSKCYNPPRLNKNGEVKRVNVTTNQYVVCSWSINPLPVPVKNLFKNLWKILKKCFIDIEMFIMYQIKYTALCDPLWVNVLPTTVRMNEYIQNNFGTVTLGIPQNFPRTHPHLSLSWLQIPLCFHTKNWYDI